MKIKEEYKPWVTSILFCLTLGLAPFTPEPHIVGKLRWIAGGAAGMKPMDWFDALLHSAPWLYLLFELGKLMVNKIKE